MEVKLVLVGNTTVGKTCIVKREVMGVYEELMQPTLGAAYTSREVHVKDRTVSVQMWDTAGQERYKAMGPMYYHGVNVALIVYAVDSRSSFAAITNSCIWGCLVWLWHGITPTASPSPVWGKESRSVWAKTRAARCCSGWRSSRCSLR